ncbi:hypothetical protein [Malacoplasma iowae]|uniref:Uncharacterized protein n=1 Tax=Malacoplasma iowae 695 TaxID=1048830 RepID=A0A6P1LII2_MALIO|nr:hypothetical protein [Malacoplasma iowae]VEU61633.1 Uncharacterised protein [Mycoplasmopsis fermentans]EGZ31174.1 hypothetical protein GUU_03318 [Malacoplasma iowae 695]QHG90221.1 hypothetical protein EER00_05040 [Malacoplasma iowae 695]WPL36026.1 hypothetical protein QX180_01245 [Malacoplasma iowae]VEU71310.1 Uncharacterised protein [Malacoplasma iowae]
MNYSKKLLLKIIPILSTVIFLTLPISCSNTNSIKIETQKEKESYEKENLIDNELIKESGFFNEVEIIKSLIIKKYLKNNSYNLNQFLIEFNYKQKNDSSSIKFSEWKNNIDKVFIFNKKTKILSFSHFYDQTFVDELNLYLITNNLINENIIVKPNYNSEIYFDVDDYCFKVNFSYQNYTNDVETIYLQINIPIENIEFNFNVNNIVVIDKFEDRIVFQNNDSINLKGIVPLDHKRINNSFFERKIFIKEINESNILNELGFIDKQTNQINENYIKKILKLNSIKIKGVTLTRQSYYMYQLNISLISYDNIYWFDLTTGEKIISINNIFVSNNFSKYTNKIDTYQNKTIPTVIIDNFQNYEINYNHLKLFLLDLNKNQIDQYLYPKIKDYLVLENSYIDKIIDLIEIKDEQNKLICYQMKVSVKSNYDSIFIIEEIVEYKTDLIELNCFLNFVGKL